MKNICFFNSNIAWGGGEKWNHHFSLLLRDAGYNVTVVTNKKSELYERLQSEKGIDLYSVKISNLSFLNPATLFRLKSFFIDKKINTLITALPSDAKIAGMAAKLAGVNKIIYRRGIAIPVKNTALNRFIYSKVIDNLIVNSLETKRTVLANNKNLIPDNKIKLIYNGFDVKEFDNQKTSPYYKNSTNSVIIGNAARLTEQKGQTYLLEAAEILKEKGLDFKILIAGKGELESKLKKMITDRNLTDCVEMVGFVTEMKSFYQSLDVFCLPSLWEGFGYALVEAMALEKPVVAFNVSSNPEIVSNNETGILTPVKNSEKLATALEQLIKNPQLRDQLGKAGRKRVRENYDTPKVLGKLIELINE